MNSKNKPLAATNKIKAFNTSLHQSQKEVPATRFLIPVNIEYTINIIKLIIRIKNYHLLKHLKISLIFQKLIVGLKP